MVGKRRALGDHQDQAVVDQVDHPGLLRTRWRRSSTMIRIMQGRVLAVEVMKTTTTTPRQKAEPQTTSPRSLKKRRMKMSMRRIMVRCGFSTKITTTMEESTEKAKKNKVLIIVCARHTVR